MVEILELLVGVLVKLVIVYFENGRLDLQRVLGVVLVKLLVEKLNAHVVHEEVFSRATLVEVIKVRIVFLNLGRFLILQFEQRLHFLLFLILLFD